MPGCSASSRIVRVAGSKPNRPRLVITCDTPPKRSPAGAPRVAGTDPAGAGDEVDPRQEAALLVHRHDHQLAAEGGDVVAAAAARQSYLRVVERPDDAGVHVAVLVDLRAAHEGHVDVAALREVERVGDPRQHRRAVGEAHLVRRDRQAAGQSPRSRFAALDDHRQVRRVGALRQRHGEQRQPHAGEDDHAVRRRAAITQSSSESVKLAVSLMRRPHRPAPDCRG